jgi:quercetin dioxygenase-like cupin family protein
MPEATLHHVHARAPLCALDDGPLRGLRHRSVIDRRNGAAQLALWQEEHLPGFSVPAHLHDCEEIITVIEGEIEARLVGDRHLVRSGESVLIPAGTPHGFRVIGVRSVRLLALFASPRPAILRPDGTPSRPPWEGAASDHLSDAG